MHLPFFPKSKRVGISISDASIELIEVRLRSNGRAEVRSAGVAALEPGIVERAKVLDVDRLAAALRQLRASANPSIQAEDIFLALPDAATYFHIFRFPGSLTDGEVANALSFQAEEVIPFPAEELLGDFFVTARSTEETVAAYAVARRESVAAFRNACDRAGLKPSAIVLEAEGLTRALLGETREGKASLVVDAGDVTSTMFLRDEDGLFATFTSVIAGRAMTEAVARVKKTTPEKAEVFKRKIGVAAGGDAAVRKVLLQAVQDLARQISQTIRWYEETREGRTVDELVLAGGTSEMPGIADALEDALAPGHPNVKVRVGQPFLRAEESPLVTKLIQNGGASAFAAAIGAALPPAPRERTFDFLTAGHRVARSARAAAFASRLPVGKRHDLRARFEALPERTKLLTAGGLIVIAVLMLLGALLWRNTSSLRVEAELQALEDAQNVVTIPEEMNISVTFSVEPEAGTVPTRVVQTTIRTEESFVPSNAVPVDAQATGIVTITNSSTHDQGLIATTRLLSAEGVLFRLRDAVQVPSGESIEAVVYADVPGESGNSGPSHFTIPGLSATDQALIFGDSTSPMEGGIVSVGTVSEADIEAAAERALAEAAIQSPEAFAPVLSPGETVWPELMNLVRTSLASDVPVGDATALATVSVVFDASAMAFHTFDLATVTNQNAATELEIDPGLFEGMTPEVLSKEVQSLSDDLTRAVLQVSVRYPQAVE